MLTGPLFMLQVYDRVLASGSISTLVALIIIVAALYAYYGFLEFLRARLMVRLGRRVEERLRGRVFDAVTAHALRRTPGVGSQPLNDLATIRQYLSGPGPIRVLRHALDAVLPRHHLPDALDAGRRLTGGRRHDLCACRLVGTRHARPVAGSDQVDRQGRHHDR